MAVESKPSFLCGPCCGMTQDQSAAVRAVVIFSVITAIGVLATVYGVRRFFQKGDIALKHKIALGLGAPIAALGLACTTLVLCHIRREFKVPKD